jgi:acetylornithine deacetylase/succinyl-diaminopimelate desuccinylase-like protein
MHETNGHPIVYAEHCHQPDRPTVLLYGHYDVQPPDPVELWHSPPFEPTVRDDKIFARGATDDKGQFYAHVKGIEALMHEADEFPVNIKMVVEGEEEVGSSHLERWVKEHQELLECDAVLISDTAMFDRGLPSITYSLRGLVYFEVTLQGPSHDLHSGVYGGAVPNPINELARIVGDLHDDQGRVAIPGFYDDVRDLSDEERASFAELPFSEEGFLEEVGVSRTVGEEGYSTLERCWARPTLDCNGIFGGFTGKGAKTVIGSTATAKISCRLVPGQDPRDIARKAEEAIRAMAPDYVDVSFEFFHGASPVIAERDNPTVQASVRALSRSWDTEPVFVGSGGSIPVVATFADVLGVPSVLVGYGLEDDRLHSPNEKFDLENYYKGIETSALLYEEIGAGD